MKKILVVYNVCGIKSDNLNHMWAPFLNNILTQEYENFYVCISGCMISEASKNYFKDLQKNSPSKIFLSFVDNVLPVNITFNAAIKECSKYMDFDGFLYVASDVDMGGNKQVISKMAALHFSSNYGITSCPVSFDSGIEAWMGADVFNHHLQHQHFEIPVGKTCNLHCMLFDKKIYDAYNSRILPDIFRTYCTESVFSFMTSALSLRFVIHDKSILVTHLAGKDGSSAGFGGYRGWMDMFNPQIPAQQRLMSQEAWNVGFGYEEYINIFVHDNNKYNPDGTCKNPQALLDFTRKALFLSPAEFNYNTINHTFLIDEQVQSPVNV